jgi:hypothetical protein
MFDFSTKMEAFEGGIFACVVSHSTPSNWNGVGLCESAMIHQMQACMNA